MSQGPSKVAYALLFLMTISSFGGPFLIQWTLNGGEKPGWPPDRAVEWVAVGGVTGAVVLLMISILVYGLTFRQTLKLETTRTEADPASTPDGAAS